MSDQNYLQKSVILLTGGAGFLGKVVLEQLMRQKDSLGIDRVILLLRSDRKRDPVQRFRERVATSPCFRNLPAEWEKHIEVLAGDLSMPNWGLTAEQQLETANQITHIIHSAASVDFNLPLKDAANANITTTLSTIDFAKACTKLKQFIYVSTAYVRPHTEGAIAEELVALPLDPAKTYDDIINDRANESALLTLTGHPNTYTFTKCVAEHLVAKNRGHLPITVVRPSIISAALKSPFPGWIDSYAALAAFVGVFGAGYLRVVAADPEARLDVVPVDEVSRIVVDQCFKEEAIHDHLKIVHAAVGLSNAMRIGDLPAFGTQYFNQFPARRQAYLRYLGPLNTMRRLQHIIFERIPTRLVWLAARITGRKSQARQIGKLDHVLKSIFKLFPYFTHNSFDFKMSYKKPVSIDRDAYLQLICEGVRTHLLR